MDAEAVALPAHSCSLQIPIRIRCHDSPQLAHGAIVLTNSKAEEHFLTCW